MRVKDGDTRICKGFLLFPLTIRQETRWLEYTSWEEVYVTPYSILYPFKPYWKPTKWMDKK